MARKALGPAMLELVAAVDAAVGSDQLLVGCSGGPDSLALAGAVAVVAKRRGQGARAVVIDHGLQKGSGDVATKAAERARKVGLDADVVPVEVVDTGEGPEAAARNARHAALEAIAATVHADVLLGQTLDDQAETVLLGLARGSGARSLSGMPVRRGRLVRPFLGVRRAVTKAACAELGVKYWNDPHNEDPTFARVRVRRTVLPMLEEQLGPGIAEALARTATMLRTDADYLDSRAHLSDLGHELSLNRLSPEPAIRYRQLRQWLVANGAVEPTFGHVRAVADLVDNWHGQARIELPGLKVGRAGNRLLVLPD
ncbi:tRNA lysidine(34) synthetase TilS [Granulicoccus phenolivorans]|uniref:tRNA lysidine(34) synthetase TilS n=1 Tax=Granulicoccus phenolivorans TaxID=266854 RepID=UPI000479D7EB|nr:tRNA lysidine(34) synthetase TilS [Granulicoccus phenolivorans]